MQFDIENKDLIRSCKPILEELYKKYRRKYIELFFHEKDIAFNKFDLSPLVKCKILRKVNGKYRPNVQVFPLSGKFICTDFIISSHRIKNSKYVRRRDDVWGILAYESPYIAKKAMVKKGDLVLDMATGSGIIALFCAEKAKKVIATDINPRAINFATFNAILNGLESKIEFRLGDMFKPISGMKFNLIIWNGPTISTPGGKEKNPIYCYGGASGNVFTKKFINESPKYLKRNGRMQWLDPSLGTEKEPETIRFIKENWKIKPFKIIYEDRVGADDLFKVIKYTDKKLVEDPYNGIKCSLSTRYITREDYEKWIDFLKRNNYTHIYALMVIVQKNKNFRIRKVVPKKILFRYMNYLPMEWHMLGYGRINQLIKICENY